MSGQKVIEVNQSSLLSLRAELLRKKQEVHDAKLSDFPNRPTPVTKLKTKLDKSNDGLEERNRRDAEEIEEECDLLKKAHSILEAKSKLYDKLSKNKNGGDNFLVDFRNKEPEEEEKPEEEEEEEVISEYEGDEEEWVDFVDCLGRTKRCHRDDLESMKSNDEKLRASLFGSLPPREGRREQPEEEARPLGEDKIPELCSEDMRREMMRQKWEDEERKLMDLKNIHYQHVLFDEARSHGAAYYNFSTDEAERSRQMEELRNLRKATLQQQAATQDAASRKKKQMQERLKAARRRKRERLGLPPAEETDEIIEDEEPKVEKPKELKREVQESTSVRPWDIGKDKVPRILTQDEWIEKRREERHHEFAPPQFSGPTKLKKAAQKTVPEAYPEDLKDSVEERKGSEIAPPPSLEMYGPSSAKKSRTGTSQSEIEKSIEEGLKYIRQQVEERQAEKTKGFIDIM